MYYVYTFLFWWTQLLERSGYYTVYSYLTKIFVIIRVDNAITRFLYKMIEESRKNFGTKNITIYWKFMSVLLSGFQLILNGWYNVNCTH